MTLMDRFVDMFTDVMSNRPLSIVVMLSAAAGGIVTIAGGFYGTFLLITYLSN